MTGKEKCKLLKAIRREIAETNGIVYLTSECTFEGDCKGTCPKCDAEIRYLDSEINRLIASGKSVSLAGLSLKTFDKAVERSSSAPVDPIVQPSADLFEESGSVQAIDPEKDEKYIPASMGSLGLEKAPVDEVSQLLQKSASEMSRVRELGQKSMDEVMLKLQELGRSLEFKELTPRIVKNTIFGFAIADALGVPVEFLSRDELAANPVTGYRGYGSHRVPAGTWSDDTSMTLATLDSMASGVNYSDIMEKFCNWLDNAAYTATNEVFDVGNTTYAALRNFKNGRTPLECGCCGEHDNGNGSLMRIIPAIIYTHLKMKDANVSEKLALIYDISSLTHGHPRTKMACGIYFFILDALFNEPSKQTVIKALLSAEAYYRNTPDFSSEYVYFTRLFSSSFDKTAETEIKSSGYVVDTLEAAVWCLLNTDSYRECVLKAVNLGSDTDTVAAVAGGLAGCLYCGKGKADIPDEWLDKLLNSKQIDELCNQLFKDVEEIDDSFIELMGEIEEVPGDTDAALDLTIEELDFGTRTFMCLKRHGVRTVRDLTMMTLDDFMTIQNLGRKCLKEIEDKLAMLGFHIAKK